MFNESLHRIKNNLSSSLGADIRSQTNSEHDFHIRRSFSLCKERLKRDTGEILPIDGITTVYINGAENDDSQLVTHSASVSWYMLVCIQANT
jgi:hypothetical protein